MKDKKALPYYKLASFLLILFVGIDLWYTWYEFYGQSLKGNLIPLVLPDSINAPLLADPFGFKALLSGIYHPNINRYFCAANLELYFKSVPFIFQKFVDPVQSIYLSTSVLKFTVYISLIISFLRYTSVVLKSRTKGIFLLLLVPFFQVDGIISVFNFIDNSIVYLFFYGLPFTLLTYFLFPLFKLYITNVDPLKNRSIQYIIYFLLGFVLAFSSALASPVLLIFITLYGFEKWRIKRSTSVFEWKKWDTLFLVLYPILIYSLLLGTFNSESADPISLVDRFSKLSEGIFHFLVKEPTLLITWILSAILFYFLRIQKVTIWNGKFNILILYFIAFVLVYTCFLPFGGYRDYRSMILRYDTLMPISMLSLLVVSTLFSYAIVKSNRKWRSLSIGLFIITAIYFSINDYNRMKLDKYCEKENIPSLKSNLFLRLQ